VEWPVGADGCRCGRSVARDLDDLRVGLESPLELADPHESGPDVVYGSTVRSSDRIERATSAELDAERALFGSCPRIERMN